MSRARPNTLREFRADVRRAVADYMSSEGCDCCRDITTHPEHAERLAKLLNVPRYSDGGRDWQRFQTKSR